MDICNAAAPGVKWRANNLSAVRLLLSVAVIFSHSFPLALGAAMQRLDPMWRLTNQFSFGSLAVDGFFCISGLLITASWLRSANVGDYFLSRILRIYPGYICAMLFCVAILLVEFPDYRKLAGGSEWLQSFSADVFLLSAETISGAQVFPANPFPWNANGSLWTIQNEYFCYILVAIVGVLGGYRRKWVVLGLWILVYVKYIYLQLYIPDTATWRFLTYFGAGACICLFRKKIPHSPRLACAMVLLVCVGCMRSPWGSVVLPLALAYCVFWLSAVRQVEWLRRCDQTDLSYGVYLYGFPVQQAIVHHMECRSPYLLFALATPIVLILANLSWFCVERPFLNLKHRQIVGYSLLPVCPRLMNEQGFGSRAYSLGKWITKQCSLLFIVGFVLFNSPLLRRSSPPLILPSESSKSLPVGWSEATSTKGLGVVDEARLDGTVIRSRKRRVLTRHSSYVYLRGWVADPEEQDAHPEVLLMLCGKNSGGKLYFKANRYERSDVAGLYKIAKYLNSGFEVRIRIPSDLPNDTYAVSILQKGSVGMVELGTQYAFAIK